jgi:cardiolipin synthase
MPESADNPLAQLQFLVSRPHCENQYDSILKNIDRAQQRIWIQMYCLTDTGIIDKIIAAKHRDVDIRILLDANEYTLGLRLHGAPNLAFCQKFMNNGISVRIYRSEPGHQMHQKSMLVDNDIVMVGATNFTRQSFRVNTESMFVIKSRAVAGTFEQRFRTDWQYSSDRPMSENIASHRIYYTVARWASRYL